MALDTPRRTDSALDPALEADAAQALDQLRDYLHSRHPLIIERPDPLNLLVTGSLTDGTRDVMMTVQPRPSDSDRLWAWMVHTGDRPGQAGGRQLSPLAKVEADEWLTDATAIILRSRRARM